MPDCRDVLKVNDNPLDVGAAAVALALAVFSPMRTKTTSGEHEVVSETETVVPKFVPADALPSSESEP